jgi:hypothetical protein
MHQEEPGDPGLNHARHDQYRVPGEDLAGIDPDIG